MNICVVCSGNICRSPFAEYILKRELGDKHQIYSAGTLEIYGRQAYSECIYLAPDYRVDLFPHSSQGLTTKLVKKTDILLGMTKAHCQIMKKRYNVPDTKVQMLSHYLPEGQCFQLVPFGKVWRGEDIPDPVGENTQIVKPVLDLIELACISFARTLEKRNGKSLSDGKLNS